MRRRHLAPFVFAGIVGGGSVAGATGCTALVKFDDPPADGGAPSGDDDDDTPDAAGQDVTTTTPDAAVDAARDAGDGGDATTSDAGDAGDGATDAAADAADGSPNLLVTCPTACDGYTAGNFWVCGWKRAACIADQADLNIVDCNDSEAISAYTCPTGQTCLGSGNEDFCDPCQGQTFGTVCDTKVQDPSHPAYLVECNGTAAPTYVTCSDTSCAVCSTTVKTTAPP